MKNILSIALFSLLAISTLLPQLSLAQTKKPLPTVEILVASWCVHCRDLEKFLQNQNIGYLRLDIEKDKEGRKRYQQLGGGGVPMVIIGNSVLKGFDKEAILELLQADKSPQVELTSLNSDNLNSSK